MSRQGIKPKINALSTIMFAFVLMLLIIVNVRQAREQKKERNGRHGSKKNKLVLMLLGLMTLSLILSGCRQAKPTLYVYNWGGDYIDEDILDEFEKETGMKIVYDTFATNEDMYVKIKSGGEAPTISFSLQTICSPGCGKRACWRRLI